MFLSVVIERDHKGFFLTLPPLRKAYYNRSMPYVLFALGVALGVYGLYKFFLTANTRQITTFFITGSFAAVCIALFFMAVTGRLPAAIGLVLALWPLALGYWKARHDKSAKKPSSKPGRKTSLSRAEALEILGLEDPVTLEDIEEAYKRLMMKVHPDQQGSDWMAAKLNEARDLLLK